MNPKQRLKELVSILNKASKAYYQENEEMMSNLEYDALYDELVVLEKETGIVLANSPTIHVGYEALSELEKQVHTHPMLSLDKTKAVGALKDWLGQYEGILSWKLDGLTVVLTYENGELVNAVTRGNGEIGEVITNNAKTFVNIPQTIPYKKRLVMRGEAVIKYSDFNRINEEISEAKYKNPRNLCSGTVRQLNNEITAKRNVHFFAFQLLDGEDDVFGNSMKKRFTWLLDMGFDLVEYVLVNASNIEEQVMAFAKTISDNDFPSDGLVLTYEDIAYGESLGQTAKFPRNAIAFKWADELASTKLSYIEWSPSRTGLINPVAVFEPVELEGTSVSRASVHNVSILKALALGEGDEITVYKANMIIPQIAENLTRSNTIGIPHVCPACGGEANIHDMNGVESLYCENAECKAKKIKAFTHFVSRNAMNIEGLSESTLEKLIAQGVLHEVYDIYRMQPYQETIVKMEGLGEKSYQNLQKAIAKSRNVELPKFIYSLGIPNIGLANAKMICKQFQYNFEQIRRAEAEELVEIDGIGDVIAIYVAEFFKEHKNNAVINQLLKEITFTKQEEEEIKIFEEKNFVITGTVSHFTNREALKEFIEKRGGKVTGSVTSKTNYLINNDVLSNSSKNKKAKELNVPIISEEEFLSLNTIVNNEGEINHAH